MLKISMVPKLPKNERKDPFFGLAKHGGRWYDEKYELCPRQMRADGKGVYLIMKKWDRLAAGLLCAILAALLIVPAAAHGCHGGRGRGHHGGCGRNVQTEIAVCPYEDCTIAGRHSHDGTGYCGYAHADGLCDGSCRALCPLEDCTAEGRHLHGHTTYCGAHHDCGFCDGSCLQAP